MAFFLRGVALGLDTRQWSANWFSFFQSYVKELHFFKHYPVYTVYCLAGITLDGHDDLEGVTERLYNIHKAIYVAPLQESPVSVTPALRYTVRQYLIPLQSGHKLHNALMTLVDTLFCGTVP